MIYNYAQGHTRASHGCVNDRRNYYTGASLCDREKSLSEQTLRFYYLL